MTRILYVATADARGHLMRAQLLVHALRAAGCQVQVLTTSDAGLEFLRSFGIEAEILSHHYAVQFDEKQNMQRGATDGNVARYVFHPARMGRDMRYLSRRFRMVDLVINDSFHPALLCMGAVPRWGRKLVHVYGASLKAALCANFDGRLPRSMARAFAAAVEWQLRGARCCLEHDFAYAQVQAITPRYLRMPTPVALVDAAAAIAIASASASATSVAQTPAAPGAVMYLNPHFRDTQMADALCTGLTRAGLSLHAVGEGLAGHGCWQAVDADWVQRAAQARLIVSAPGMAALSAALVYRRPIVLVLTDQPEQQTNAQRAAQLGLAHGIVVWRGDTDDFTQQVEQAARTLAVPAPTPAQLAEACELARQRLQAWVDCLLALPAQAAVSETELQP